MSDSKHVQFPDLPPYTYVPGQNPHPVSDPSGHMHQSAELPSDWSNSDLMRWGCILFNAGYYWESHEVWEQLWIRLGRVGPQSDALKGLIKLAACGVKCLEANARGAKRHALRATELLNAHTELPNVVDFAGAAVTAEALAENSPVLAKPSSGEPTPLAGMHLECTAAIGQEDH